MKHIQKLFILADYLISLFNNLEPKNSDSSCKENANAININSIESTQANISQLENDNNNLPELKNYDDFSKENDSIISVESSAVTQSLQIDISQIERF
ncbi:unnamed protein product [Rhizophagus irregularis]|nr:unnamed protein product [Rhizophagus irregularis]